MKFLYDTGASCTVLSTQVWDRIPPEVRPELECPQIELSTVGDQAILNRGSCSLVVEFDGRPVTCTVQVCEISEEAVLGLDVLSDMRGRWDWDRGVLELTPPQGGPGLTNSTSSVERGVDPCWTQHDDGGSDSLCGEPGGQSEECPGDIEPPSDLTSHVMEVMKEPNLGLEELWPVVGGSSPSSGPVEEETVIGLLRSIGRSRPLCDDVTSHPLPPAGAPPEGLPDHLQQLYTESITQLSVKAQHQFAALLTEFSHVFSKNDHDLGRTGLEVHHIPTGDARPIRLSPRRAPMHLRADIEHQVQEMLDQGIVEECTSSWSAPLVIVKKKDGSNRICVDFRALNEVTEKDGHPIPRIEDSLDALAGATIFSTLDMTSGYHQVEVAEADRDKTAFVTGRGHHLRFVTMPFGLCNAPSTFQRLMERVLQGLVWKTVVVYLDDVVIFSRSPEEHLEHLREVMQRFEQHNLKLKPRKCELMRSQVKYLGHIVSESGVATDPELIEKVTDWTPPRTQKQVRAFLGLTGYYRSYVPKFGEVAEPLVRLTDAHADFVWTPACHKAFEELKSRLVSAPILAYPNQEDLFILDTDASDTAIGAVLSQSQEGHEWVILYGSKALSREERNYCVTRKELLAVVHFVEAYRYYLYGRPFLVRTDHAPLKWMLRQKEPKDQLARWNQRMAPFKFTIEHRPGPKHGNADGMSRLKCFRGGECFHPLEEDPDPPGTRTSSEALRAERWTAQELVPASQGRSLAKKPRKGDPGNQQGSDSSLAELGSSRVGPVEPNVSTGSPPPHAEQAVAPELLPASQERGLAKQPGNSTPGIDKDCAKQNGSDLEPETPPTSSTPCMEEPAAHELAPASQEGSLAKEPRRGHSKPAGRQKRGGSQMEPRKSKGTKVPKVAAVLRAIRSRGSRRATRREPEAQMAQAGPTGPDATPEAPPAQPALPAGMTLEQLAQAQQDDPDLRVIRARLEAGLPKPAKQEISPLSPVVKYWCARWEQLEIRDHVLKYRWEPNRAGDPVTYKILAPKSMQETIMTCVHDLKSAGHLGIARTFEKATRSPFLWAGMRADLARWVRRCQLCQQRKPPAAKKRAKMVTYQVGAPWERIAADIAGPFPTT